MFEYQPNIVLSEQDYAIVGKRPIRPDGVAKVTGRATYGADIRLPGMLYGKILRSPYAHARIRSIDTGHAEELPRVYATITAPDRAQPSGKLVDLAEGVQHNMRFLSNNIMAADKVLYKGHAVAAVAATSPHLAEEALALIQVEYEELPPVLTAAEAMKPGAPLLHDRLASLITSNIRPAGLLADDDPTPGSNLANRIEFRLGDVDQGFQEADVIVEHETFTCPIHQGYIEPHTGTAQWNNDGTLTIWSSSQGHFNVRDQTARLLNVPVSMVRAIPMEIGGGFGGKTIVYVEPVAAALARKAGRPVKVTMSRTDVLEATGPTSGTQVRVKHGATKDGRLVAGEAHLIYEAGAFPWGVATFDLTPWNAAIIHCSCRNTPSMEEGTVMTTAQVGYTSVHRWVKQVLGQTHTTVIMKVARAVLCLLVAQRVTSAALARALPAAQAGSGRSCLRRVRRWWRGPALEQATISPARIRLALTLLATEQPVVVALDTARLGPWEVWLAGIVVAGRTLPIGWAIIPDRKSTRLNSSHLGISYAV